MEKIIILLFEMLELCDELDKEVNTYSKQLHNIGSTNAKKLRQCMRNINTALDDMNRLTTKGDVR